MADVSTPEAVTVDRAFWENDLQMCLDPWLQTTANTNYMRKWVGDLTNRQLRMLCDCLGLDSGAKPERQRDSLVSCNGQLTPYFLVERFHFRRSKFAVADHAATVLPGNTVEACRTGEEGFDTLASCALGKPTMSGLAILGDISISGTIIKVEELAAVLQVCLNSGAKKVLVPITSATEIGAVPSDLIGAFSLIFYSTPQEAVFKALGVE